MGAPGFGVPTLGEGVLSEVGREASEVLPGGAVWRRARFRDGKCPEARGFSVWGGPGPQTHGALGGSPRLGGSGGERGRNS